MKKMTIQALGISAVVMLAISLSACERNADAGSSGEAPLAATAENAPAPAPTGPVYAQVVSVDPVRQSVNNPQQNCRDQVVTHTLPPKDQHHIAGTAIGAVAGGLLGHLVGGGRGNTLTTVAGAVGGGYAGNRIEASHQQGQVVSTNERVCNTVNNVSSQIVAYDVRYVYDGVTRTVRLDHDPGNRVQVLNGVATISDAH